MVVGAGIVGASISFWLARAGFAVTLIEKGRVGSGSSAGNAGMVVPSFCLPLANPGDFWRSVRDIFSGGVSIAPHPALFRWGLEFALSSRWSKALATGRQLLSLASRSMDLYRVLAHEGIAVGFQTTGWLHVFRTSIALDRGRRTAERLREIGVQIEELRAEEIHSLEPDLQPCSIGGFRYSGDGHLDPLATTQHMVLAAQDSGARLVENCAVTDVVPVAGGTQVVHSQAGEVLADEVVLATGAWTGGILRNLGIRQPILPGRGISITLLAQGLRIRQPLMLGDAHIVITTLQDRVRATGGMGLGHWDQSPRKRELDILRVHLRPWLPQLADSPVTASWAGLRPMTPSGAPIVKRLRPGLIVASGHGTLGVTLAPVTAELVANTLIN